MSILNGLNEEQAKGASVIEGPLLILAGAGSGKTRTVTHRIAHMILEKNISPYEILAVTFTNKAAKEMKERVLKLAGVEGERAVVSTFHSFGIRLLRAYGDRLGYDRNFNIYDGDDQKRLIKNIMKETGISDKEITPREATSLISKLKEEGTTPEEYKATNKGFTPKERLTGDLYEKYNRTLKKNNAFDFADILVKTADLLEIPEILDRVQGRYKYIMVDEYQDTNYIQYKIIKTIAKKHKNICVVGDEDQSIYGFRGANIQNILDFEKDYPEAKVIKLEQNYRSTKKILDLANNLIANNTSSKGKKLWTENQAGSKITVLECSDDRDETRNVWEEIQVLKAQNYRLQDITLLYRTNAQSRVFEELFLQRGIPYKVFGGMQFYQRMEIKDVLAYMGVINNPQDDLSLQRIINVPKRKIGGKTLEKLQNFANEQNMSLYQSLKYPKEAGIGGSIALTIENFYEDLQKISEEAQYMGISGIYENIMKTFRYKSYLEGLGESEASRLENIQELENAINEFEKEHEGGTLSEYLENVALYSATDDLDESSDYLKLMTIHNSKGLEFPVVFLVGFEDETFPSSRVDFDPKDLEEERRLCYVAITRAEKELFLSYARARFLYGQTQPRSKSRFIEELNQDLLEFKGGVVKTKNRASESTFKRKISSSKSNLSNFDLSGKSNKCDFTLKEKVIHKKFGVGIVREISGKTLEVEFVTGKKKFLIDVATRFLTKM